jgi:DUF1680 family protein
MTSCFEGLLEYYEVTGIEKYKTAVINYARAVLNTEISIIGSCGITHELFDHTRTRQTVSYDGVMQETCVTVTWMKFCGQLLLLTGDPMYADCIEQSYYNAYVGSLNWERHPSSPWHVDATPTFLPFDSYSPLVAGRRGEKVGGEMILTDNTYYGCCACIGSAGAGVIGRNAVTLANDGLAVQFYLPGRVTVHAPSGKEVTLTTETAYPIGETVKLVLTDCAPEAFALRVRIPGWCQGATVTVNGEAVAVTAGYTVLERTWKSGDEVVLTLPMSVRCSVRKTVIEKTENAEKSVLANGYPVTAEHLALVRGPLALARDVRLGGTILEAVTVKTGADGVVEAEAVALPDGVPGLCCWKIAQEEGGSFLVMDYASAGATWTEESLCAAWLPKKDPVK